MDFWTIQSQLSSCNVVANRFIVILKNVLFITKIIKILLRMCLYVWNNESTQSVVNVNHAVIIVDFNYKKLLPLTLDSLNIICSPLVGEESFSLFGSVHVDLPWRVPHPKAMESRITNHQTMGEVRPKTTTPICPQLQVKKRSLRVMWRLADSRYQLPPRKETGCKGGWANK